MPLIKSIFQDCKRILRQYSANDMQVYAAQASFFIIIAVFPFVMLLLTALQFIPSVNKADLMSLLVPILPEGMGSLIVGFLYVNDLSVSTNTVLSVTALTALWAAAIGMMGIERGLNKINECAPKRNYIIFRLISALYTLVFMLICVLCMMALVFGSTLSRYLLQSAPSLVQTAEHYLHVGRIISFFILFLFFIGIYCLVPHKKQNLIRQIPGALFSTAGWMLFSYLYSIYFRYFGRFSTTYGSLTAFVLFMLWLYFCLCILFMGAQINHYIQHPSV